MGIVEFFSKQRVFTATVFIAITMTACILGGIWWAIFLLLLIYIGTEEMIKLLNAKEIYPSLEVIRPISITLIFLAYCNRQDLFIHILVLGIILSFVRFVFKSDKVTSADIFATFFIICYSALLPVHFILIRNITTDVINMPNSWLEPGAGFLLLTLMGIWTSDIGAYYVGRKLGKRPLCPVISPKKTVEGAIGGTIAGILMVVLMGFIIQISILNSIILGIIIVAMAQLGDLCESLLKRDVGVKDSGDIVPGHGGVMDRADSYIFTAAAAFYYIQFIIVKGIL